MSDQLYSEAAEQALIGAALRTTDVIGKMTAAVQPTHFWSERNRAIFTTIADLYDKHQQVDILLVTEALRITGKLTELGGQQFLYDCIEASPDPYNWHSYGDIVLAAFMRRQVANVGQQMINASTSTEFDVLSLLEKSQRSIDKVRKVGNLSKIVSFKDLVAANRVELDYNRTNPNPVRGIRTRMSNLDKKIGGFEAGMFYLVLGSTNMGKSTFACSVIRDFVELSELPGVVISTESEPGRYLNKITAAMTKITYDKISTGQLSEDEYEMVQKAYNKLAENGSVMLDVGSPTPQLVKSTVRDAVREVGIRWIVVDSLSKMHIPGTSDIYETSKTVANEMQDLAREAKLPLLATAQVKPAVAGRSASNGKKIPKSEDTAGGADAPNNADVVLSIYNHNHYVELGEAEPDSQLPKGYALVRVTKHRWREARSQASILQMVGGAGFYEPAINQDYDDSKNNNHPF